MANNFGKNESISEYIINLSNENKKKKYFIKFTMLSDNNQTIDGWVFSSIGGILTTPLGQALGISFKNKTDIKLWGSIENNQDKNEIFHTTTFAIHHFHKSSILQLRH